MKRRTVRREKNHEDTYTYEKEYDPMRKNKRIRNQKSIIREIRKK